MTQEIITYNIYPIFKFIIILFAVVGGYNVLNNLFNLISRGFKDKLDNAKDINIINGLLDKFPLVNPEFINKNQKEMAIENNQEIQEINKKLELMEDAIRSNIKHIMELEKNG